MLGDIVPDHNIKINEGTWKKIKILSVNQEMTMKKVIDKVFSGEMNPLETL
jgi:hypothetical protein